MAWVRRSRLSESPLRLHHPLQNRSHLGVDRVDGRQGSGLCRNQQANLRAGQCHGIGTTSFKVVHDLDVAGAGGAGEEASGQLIPNDLVDLEACVFVRRELQFPAPRNALCSSHRTSSISYSGLPESNTRDPKLSLRLKSYNMDQWNVDGGFDCQCALVYEVCGDRNCLGTAVLKMVSRRGQ